MYHDCLVCKETGATPVPGKGVALVFDPQMIMPRPPTIRGHRLGASFMAERVWRFGIESEMEDYELSREELLVACWWVGEFGPRRKIKTAFKEWAVLAGRHLWYGCINISDPPLFERA